jgi:hypothetical protein
MTTTPEQRAELRRLLAEAKLPWKYEYPNGFCDCGETESPTPHEDYGLCENWVWEDASVLDSRRIIPYDDYDMMAGEDCELAAKAVNVLPALLDTADYADKLVLERMSLEQQKECAELEGQLFRTEFDALKAEDARRKADDSFWVTLDCYEKLEAECDHLANDCRQHAANAAKLAAERDALVKETEYLQHGWAQEVNALKADNERLRELLGDVAGECVAETARGIRLKEEVRAALKEKDVNKHADAQTSCPHGIPHRYACDVCDVPEGALKGGKYE